MMKKSIQTILAVITIFGLNVQLSNGQFLSNLSLKADVSTESKKIVSVNSDKSENSYTSEESEYTNDCSNKTEIQKSLQVQTESELHQGNDVHGLLSYLTSSDEEEAEEVENWMLNPNDWLSK